MSYFKNKNPAEKFVAAMYTAQELHGEQLYGGRPYYLHCVEVSFEAEKVAKEFGYDAHDDLLCSALLHDVLEDTNMTEPLLRKMFGYLITTYVSQLTKLEHLTYQENIEHLIQGCHILGDPGAIIVKIADNRCNLRNNPKPHNVEKYKKSLATLESALSKFEKEKVFGVDCETFSKVYNGR